MDLNNLNQMVITECTVIINPRIRLTDNQLMYLMGLTAADARGESWERFEGMLHRTVSSLRWRGLLKDEQLPWRRNAEGRRPPQKATYRYKLTPAGRKYLETKDPIKLLKKIRKYKGFALIKLYAFEYIISLLPLHYLPEFLISDMHFERKLARMRYTQLTQGAPIEDM